MSTDVPRPGSDAAVALGCTCPVLDNRCGAGVPFSGGSMWWQTDGCPVHTTERLAFWFARQELARIAKEKTPC